MVARKIDTSPIAAAPPYAREIWFYLLRAANHKDNHICKRGQTIRRYADIQDALKWYVGYRKCVYTKAQCENAMKLLVKATMITKMRTTRGLLITICKYNFYQNPQSYESHNETATSAAMEPQGCHTINKNVKNVKNDKKKYIGADFKTFWSIYPKKQGKGAARKSWFKIRPSDDLVKKILAAVEQQQKSMQWQEEKGKYIPNPATWLNQERWDDILEEKPKEKTPMELMAEAEREWGCQQQK